MYFKKIFYVYHLKHLPKKVWVDVKEVKFTDENKKLNFLDEVIVLIQNVVTTQEKHHSVCLDYNYKRESSVWGTRSFWFFTPKRKH